jgi:hypothetical protein
MAVGAAAGGLLAAAFLPMAVANADDIIYVPDNLTFVPDPSTEWGIPGLLSGATGVEDWSTNDYTTHIGVLDSLSGQDTNIFIGSGISFDLSNDLFTVSSNISDPGGLAPGSVLDYTFSPFCALGGCEAFGNEFIDAAAGSTTPGITDILLTPTGDFVLF